MPAGDTPAQCDILITRGAVFHRRWVLDINGSATDVTAAEAATSDAYTVPLQVADGVVTLDYTAAETLALEEVASTWDAFFTFDGERHPVLAGQWRVVTRLASELP